MSVLAITAFAGDPIGPQCTPDPGIIPTPPCAAAQMTTDDSAMDGIIQSPPAADISTIIEDALIALLLF
jgi:hypothetical protein